VLVAIVAAVAGAVFTYAVTERSRLGGIAYGLAILYVAINVPVTRVLGSPLTGPMLLAARGPLADSISQYVTLANIPSILSIVSAGVVMPRVLRRWRTDRDTRRVRDQAAAFGAAVIVVILGAAGSSRVD